MSGPRPQSPSAGGHAPGYRAIRWDMDWVMRPLFGIVLAGIAILALVWPEYFAGMVVLITALAAYEWHRMVAVGRDYRLETAITSLTAAAAVLILLMSRQIGPALLAVAIGALVAVLVARSRGQSPVWQGLGVVYLGLPAIALVSLRAFPERGWQVIAGLFLIVWATDTGALIFGKLIGGPRMAPVLSPSKTWAGTIGGSVTAALVFSCYIWLLGGTLWIAALFGLAFSAVAHAGDLFESFVKRRFGIKNSGSLIPGHGGVLDRMDSTIFASVALAILVFGTHFNLLFGIAS
ncbi:MAG: phosphatidate cytidylyltransferase [Proteobacteria bacterium]|nr:phosphatidate cytidylyltransferase [Pseudomonadota bacterium]